MLEDSFFAVLENFIVLDFFLPFILIFSIIFGALSNVKLFQKNMTIMMSIAIAGITVIPHVLGKYDECYDPVIIINGALPTIGLTVLAILMFFVIVAVVGLQMSFLNNFMGLVAVVGIVFVGFTFITASPCSGFVGGLGDLGVVLPFVVIAAIVFFVARLRGGGAVGGRDLY
jgi:hypothetical protein